MRQRRTVTPCRLPRCQREQDTSGVPEQLHPKHNDTPLQALAVYDPPIVSLGALLESDASPREIRRRLRLNFAIRCLLDAIAERQAAS